MNGSELSREIHRLALSLPRRDHSFPPKQLPSSGIYFFFEHGETAPLDGTVVDRIVRVGTHIMDGRLPKRIRQHFGNVNSLGGNKNGSVFRLHVGGSLLTSSNPSDPRLGTWIVQNGQSYAEVEESVSRTLRENFTFSCLRVESKADRLQLERGLIATLAQHPLAGASEAWRGRHAVPGEIRRTGLWNIQHCDAQLLSDEELERLRNLARIQLMAAP